MLNMIVLLVHRYQPIDSLQQKYIQLMYFFFFLQLRSGGSQILEGCIAEIPNISSLDISDNGEKEMLVMLHYCANYYTN